MKNIFALSLLVFLLAPPVWAKPEKTPLKKAMQLYARHHYTRAAEVLHPILSTVGQQKQHEGALSFGMICMANAQLYRELYRASLVVHLDYLTKLVAVDERHQSHFAPFYLAKILVEYGELIEAVGYFNKFIEDKRTRPSQRAAARIGLASAYYLQGKSETAQEIIARIQPEQPATRLALAAFYSRFSFPDKDPVDLCRQAIARTEPTAAGPSLPMICDAIGIYARESQTRAGIDLALRHDLKGFFHEETIGPNKVIHFYDPALLDNLASLYGAAAVQYLQEAAQAADDRIKWPASYQLAKALSRFNHINEANRLLDQIVTSAAIPIGIKQRAGVHQAINRFRLGDTHAAIRQLDQLMGQKAASALSAEILLTGCRYHLDYPPAVKQAMMGSRKGIGKSVARINHALGRYYLYQKDFLKAVQSLEAARDKSNKNRIEFNDPLLLVDLATANYRIKRFSETLETYFEMSKQFPAVRQIQIATQGVYSMEQKSAGDAKIF